MSKQRHDFDDGELWDLSIRSQIKGRNLAIIDDDNNLAKEFINKNLLNAISYKDVLIIILATTDDFKTKFALDTAIHLDAYSFGDFLFIDYLNLDYAGVTTIEEVFKLHSKDWCDIGVINHKSTLDNILKIADQKLSHEHQPITNWLESIHRSRFYFSSSLSPSQFENSNKNVIVINLDFIASNLDKELNNIFTILYLQNVVSFLSQIPITKEKYILCDEIISSNLINNNFEMCLHNIFRSSRQINTSIITSANDLDQYRNSASGQAILNNCSNTLFIKEKYKQESESQPSDYNKITSILMKRSSYYRNKNFMLVDRSRHTTYLFK